MELVIVLAIVVPVMFRVGLTIMEDSPTIYFSTLCDEPTDSTNFQYIARMFESPKHSPVRLLCASDVKATTLAGKYVGIGVW